MTDTTTYAPMTVSLLLHVHEVVIAASEGAKVAWANEDGDLFYGTARHIVKSPDDYGFLPGNLDVRDGYLRITTKTGMETAINVLSLAQMHSEGRFARYDW